MILKLSGNLASGLSHVKLMDVVVRAETTNDTTGVDTDQGKIAKFCGLDNNTKGLKEPEK